jgi:hypothetical protein
VTLAVPVIPRRFESNGRRALAGRLIHHAAQLPDPVLDVWDFPPAQIRIHASGYVHNTLARLRILISASSDFLRRQWLSACSGFVPFVQHVPKNGLLEPGIGRFFIALKPPFAQSGGATEGGIPRSPRPGFGSTPEGGGTETGWFSGEMGTFHGTLPTHNWRSR